MTLADRIANLVPRLADERGQLQYMLAHAADDTDTCCFKAGKILEQVVNEVLRLERIEPDRDLCKNIEILGGDAGRFPDRRGKADGKPRKPVLPNKLYSYLHTSRIVRNAGVHGDDVTDLDVQAVIPQVLALVEWFHTEYPNGPRLRTVYHTPVGPPPVPPPPHEPTRLAWLYPAVAVGVIAVLLGGGWVATRPSVATAPTPAGAAGDDIEVGAVEELTPEQVKGLGIGQEIKLGVKVRDTAPAPQPENVRIVDVDTKALADRLGIRPNDLFVKINDTPITSADGLRKAPATNTLVVVWKSGDRYFQNVARRTVTAGAGDPAYEVDQQPSELSPGAVPPLPRKQP